MTDASLPEAAPLSPAESRTLDALFDRIFPPGGDGTPGAVKIGAADYVRAALAGPYAGFVAEYRAVLSALDAAAAGDYAAAAEAVQDDILAAFEAGTLPGLPQNPDRSAFDLIWRHLREGLFCDPAHGGNRNAAGWALIGFPGAQFGYTAEDQQAGRSITRTPQAMAQLPQDARLPDAPETTDATGPVEAPDVLIVGGGAVGSFMAHRLVQAGKTVVILEAGGRRSGREHAMDELSATAFRNIGGAEKFNDEVPTWRLRPGQPARRAVMSQGLETALGGNSIAWGAVAMRFYEDDFRVRSATVAKYGEDSIPADSTLADWPMSYADLEPYYDTAERLLGVSGHAGGKATFGRRNRGNPFEGPRSRPYAMPALRTSGLGQMFADAAESCGYHPFPLPAAILTAPYEGRHACTYCSFCSRFGCHVDAKASAQNTVLPKALASGRLTVLTGARVMEILTEEGRASGVAFISRDGQRHVQKARTVVVATYAFENTRLLLLSRDDAHPQGLGNTYGQVGRHYLTRQQPSVHAVFDTPVNRFIGPTAQAMAVADLSCDHFDHTGLGFIRGGRIAAFNQYLPIEASGVLPPDVPRYGRAWRDFFVAAYARTAMLFIDPEILPSDNNRLDLDPKVKDAHGRPVVRITFDVGENEKMMIPYVQDRAVQIAEKMGAVRIWRRPVLTGPISTHDTGGTRMGDDPRTSVTDGFGRVHDTPGLVVVGGSSFVSLPPVNPALTILALSLRAADGILADQAADAEVAA